MILRWQGAMVKQSKAGLDSLGACAVSQNAANDGKLELYFRQGAVLTV